MQRKNNLIFICITILILYCFLKNILIIPLSSKTFTYIVNPIFIICLFIFSFTYLHPPYNRRKSKKDKLQVTLIVLLIYLIIYFSSGLIFGYENSPYKHDVINLLKNVEGLLLPVVLLQYVRFCLITNVNKKQINYIFITIIFCFLDINFKDLIANIFTLSGIIKYGFGVILPLIIRNVLITYLMITTGLRAAIIYQSFLQLINILLPIFPKLNWFATGLISVLLSFMILLSINKYIERKVYHYKKYNPLKRIPLYLILIILILFFYGKFKYQPVAIMSNSMVPVFRLGDAVIIEKINDKNIKDIKVGTIIIYNLDNAAIVHRVIKIINVGGEEEYITKGDNNTSPDSKSVSKSQLIGLEKFSIPKIGYPSVLLQSLINGRQPNIEK